MVRFFFRRRWFFLLPLLILAGGSGFYFFQPLPLPDLPQEAVQVDVSSSRLRPYEIQNETYILIPGTPQWAGLKKLLSGVTVHRCFQTLSGSTSTDGTGGLVLNFYGRDDQANLIWDITVTASSHLRIGDRVYHLGWWGNQSGQQLADQLAQMLTES